jgi:hypothetical protein
MEEEEEEEEEEEKKDGKSIERWQGAQYKGEVKTNHPLPSITLRDNIHQLSHQGGPVEADWRIPKSIYVAVKAKQASTALPTCPSCPRTTSTITSRSRFGNMPCKVL